MPQAIVDPEALRNFATQLQRFNEELRDLLTSIHGQFGELGATWRDQEQARFAEVFEETEAMIGQFLEVSTAHVGFLVRKAEAAKDYLDRR